MPWLLRSQDGGGESVARLPWEIRRQLVVEMIADIEVEAALRRHLIKCSARGGPDAKAKRPTSKSMPLPATLGAENHTGSL